MTPPLRRQPPKTLLRIRSHNFTTKPEVFVHPRRSVKGVKYTMQELQPDQAQLPTTLCAYPQNRNFKTVAKQTQFRIANSRAQSTAPQPLVVLQPKIQNGFVFLWWPTACCGIPSYNLLSRAFGPDSSLVQPSGWRFPLCKPTFSNARP
jgi:hypothetical protein